MKILMIVPKYTYNNFSTKKNYHYMFPIGLAYILTILKKHRKDINILNLNHKNGAINEIVSKKLNDEKYDVICTGGMSLDFPVIEKIIKVVRNHKSNPKIIIGGSIITSEQRLMAENLDFDFGVIGEGENTIIELIDCLEKRDDLENVDGIMFKKKNEKVVFTKPRKVIQNLDKLPFPDYEGLGFDEYLDNMCSTDALFNVLDSPKMYPLLGSRGCPYQCTFCYHSLGLQYRYRSIDNIMDEINYAIKRFKINSIFILDDLFSMDKERIYEFCKRIKEVREKLPHDFKWACQIAVNSVDEKLLETMKDTGCCWISFGFESFSPIVLKSMKKPITPEQIRNAIKLCLKLHIGIEGGFIFGDTAETKETAKETINFWKKECKGQLGLFFIQPYPGSEIYKRAIEKKIIKNKMDYIRNHIHKTNFFNMTETMSNKDFKKLIKEVWKLRAKGCKHVVHSKIRKENENKYEISVDCPFCKETNIFKNCYIRNKRYYTIGTICRHCMKRFYIVSKTYKFAMDHYTKLNFMRGLYLLLRKKLINKNV